MEWWKFVVEGHVFSFGRRGTYEGGSLWRMAEVHVFHLSLLVFFFIFIWNEWEVNGGVVFGRDMWKGRWSMRNSWRGGKGMQCMRFFYGKNEYRKEGLWMSWFMAWKVGGLAMWWHGEYLRWRSSRRWLCILFFKEEEKSDDFFSFYLFSFSKWERGLREGYCVADHSVFLFFQGKCIKHLYHVLGFYFI